MTTSSLTPTLSRFPAAAAGFVRDLYVEHLEEASFLYDQRNYIIENIEMEAHDIAWNEQRCDRHVDALVVGGEIVMGLCSERAAPHLDAGALYAAIRVLCKLNRPDLVENFLDDLDPGDAETMVAVGDALKHDLPKSWRAQVSQWLEKMDEPRAAILSVASAYRRLDVGSAVVVRASGPLADPVPFIWALGRLQDPSATLVFGKYLRAGDDDQREAAALGALRCGSERIGDSLRQAVALGEAWAAVPLAVAGEYSDFRALERMAHAHGVTPRLALALGLHGHLGAFDTLLGWLETNDAQDETATALQLLTGRCPLEYPSCAEAHQLEPVEEWTETNDHASEPRLAQSRTDWERVCELVRRGFDSDARVSFGEADSPKAASRAIASPSMPTYVRNLVADVLVVRHGIEAMAGDEWGAARLQHDGVGGST